jgi:hypothetical protein
MVEFCRNTLICSIPIDITMSLRLDDKKSKDSSSDKDT